MADTRYKSNYYHMDIYWRDIWNIYEKLKVANKKGNSTSHSLHIKRFIGWRYF